MLGWVVANTAAVESSSTERAEVPAQLGRCRNQNVLADRLRVAEALVRKIEERVLLEPTKGNGTADCTAELVLVE